MNVVPNLEMIDFKTNAMNIRMKMIQNEYEFVNCIVILFFVDFFNLAHCVNKSTWKFH